MTINNRMLALARLGVFVLAVLVSCMACGASDQTPDSACTDQSSQSAGIAPIAGQAFHTCFMGQRIDVPVHNRRSMTAWSVGLISVPRVSKRGLLPTGSFYLWRHPDDDLLFRGVFSVAYNKALFAWSPRSGSPWETVLSFEDFALPVVRSDFVDGQRMRHRAMDWGYVRLGAGIGWRRQVAPGHQDNMLAVDLQVEPGYYFFGRGSEDASDFIKPSATYETRLHLSVRWDALTRNLLELAHSGFALGGDAVYAHRSRWNDWGINGIHSGHRHRNYYYVTAYLRSASGLPGLGERHRLLASLHAGVGQHLDRFSGLRVGGSPTSDEFGAIRNPVIPGTLVQAYYPEHYVVATAAYRYQVTFFSYVSLHTSLAWLDRRHLQAGRRVSRRDGFMESVGVRLTTGLFFGTRLMLEYDYNTRVIRHGRHGGQAIMVQLSGGF